MKRLALAAVLLAALGVPIQAQTPDAAKPTGVQDTGASTRAGHIKLIQKVLNAFGYDAGPVDGLFGPRTEKAIRAFETAHGLAREKLERPLEAARLAARLFAVVPDFREGVAAYRNRDYATAIRVMSGHAALNDPQARFNLGLMYSKGEGVAQNYATALKWYRMAAEQGFALAQYGVAVMYSKGEGVRQDFAEAFKWYLMAAEQGHDGAQFNLGLIYSAGLGVAQDYAETLKWYRLAAAQANPDAQNNLGFMYDAGKGVPQDYVRAHMWYNLAAAHGNETAKMNRDLIAESMTPDDISRAQELTRDWLKTHDE